ncbi:unnamed protein product [Pseudo-nitzschia multistriata]|uniref:Uncharacterized protein n=1 Tax=Pseudo-nitzschia multistriata TaxID=183589 RepID=A0A448Z955_9STRA|nr:unnamed protein product [Pseudo-nitzschia multistriata]
MLSKDGFKRYCKFGACQEKRSIKNQKHHQTNLAVASTCEVCFCETPSTDIKRETMTLRISMPTVRKVLFLPLLYAVVATQTCISAGFSPARQPPSTERRGRFGRVVPFPGHARGRIKSRERGVTAIRGGGRRDRDEAEDEPLLDCGGTVAGLFGNLRIPASLIAGASLGSAFALPLLESDGPMFGFAKRMYSFLMLTALGSMLLVVILSTICMNDIAISPPRRSKSVFDYINEHYSLEWITVKSNFYYGALSFVVGAAFRAWVSISCPVFGRGIVGFLTSMTLISVANLIEKSSCQSGGCSIQQRFTKHRNEVVAKSKTNPVYGAGVLVWASSAGYLIFKIPHIYLYLSKL